MPIDNMNIMQYNYAMLNESKKTSKRKGEMNNEKNEKNIVCRFSACNGSFYGSGIYFLQQGS